MTLNPNIAKRGENTTKISVVTADLRSSLLPLPSGV